MNTKNFIALLKNPQNIQVENADALSAIIEEYPYFQAARAIQLKSLKNSESFQYNAALKKTAAHSTDRTVLFNFITSAIFKTVSTDSVLNNKTPLNSFPSKELSDTAQELAIGSPIPFSQTETHSFNQWLQLSTHKKIKREENKPLNKTAIIDKFIKQNPKISKVSKHTDKKEIDIVEQQDSYLMTETLAKVYLEQKKYGNAIKAYEILSLKYPEKSGFFADQIKRIRILQNR